MKTGPPRTTMHLRPVVRRLTIVDSGGRACRDDDHQRVLHARLVTGACWLALAGLSAYALDILKHLRP
jgi:hypothetical protein